MSTEQLAFDESESGGASGGGPYLPTSLEPRLLSRSKRSGRRPSTTGTFVSDAGTDESYQKSSLGHGGTGDDEEGVASTLVKPVDAVREAEKTPAMETPASKDEAAPVAEVVDLKGHVHEGQGQSEDVQPESSIDGKDEMTSKSEGDDHLSSLPVSPLPTSQEKTSTTTVPSADSPPPPVPPKSPRHSNYTLPIGGGPKKVVLPIFNSKPILTSRPSQGQSSNQDMSTSSLAPPLSSRSRSDSLHSTTSTATAVPNKESRNNADMNNKGKQRRKSLQSESPSKDLKGMTWVNEGGASEDRESSVERRRTLSGSNLIRDKKPLLKGRKRASTSVGHGDKVARSQSLNWAAAPGSEKKRVLRPSTAPPQDRNLATPRSMPKRRPATSSVLMVEGQMFEINDGEAMDEDGERGQEPKGNWPEDVTPSSQAKSRELGGGSEMGESSHYPFSESGIEGTRTVEYEPMIYTDEDIDDVPPPGAYAIHPPSKIRLSKASELKVYDELGNIVEFGSLFSTRRTLICFLRHWLCPFCQMFSQSLQAIDPLPLEKAELDLVVVGQGHWHVTKSYKEVMKIPKFVRMYSDPSQKVYKMLGMTLRTNDAGPACARPDYQTMGVFKASMVAMKKGVFDMPLRPPGDLKLLGGEFILGPGLQCSFTHRMVTTRGHLDLPRILVQAGCDLSLKSPTDMLEEQDQNRRPASTKSADHISAKKFKRLARRARRSAGVNGREFRRPTALEGGEPTNTLRALSGQHESQQVRTLPRTFAKRKAPPLPDVRNLNISYPIQQQSQQGLIMGEEGRAASIMERKSESRADTFGRSKSAYPASISPPSSSSGRVATVKQKLATNMVTGFSKSSSMGDMNTTFSRPPKSPNRPPLPPTSSAAAYAAAAARASSRPQSPLMSYMNNGNGVMSSESVPNFHTNGSSNSIHTLQRRPVRNHQRTPTASTATGTMTSVGSGSFSRPDTADSSFSKMSNHSSKSLPRSADAVKNNDIPITLPFHRSNSDLHKPTTATKVGSRVPAPGVPLSLFEKRIFANPKAVHGTNSTVGSPTNSTFDKPTVTSKSEWESGDETDYKRLDRQALEAPIHHRNTVDDQDIPSSVSDHDPDEIQSEWDGSNSPELHVTRTSAAATATAAAAAATAGMNGLSHDVKLKEMEDEALQKTPVARKISLDVGEMDYEVNSERGTRSMEQDRNWTPPLPSLNRSSILAAGPVSTTSRVWPSKSSSSLHKQSNNGTAVAFNDNPLFSSLPRQNSPSSRVPIPAPTPVFASLLAEAEEAARSRNSSREINRDEERSLYSRQSSLDQSRKSGEDRFRRSNEATRGGGAPLFHGAAIGGGGGGSFLDQLDVHDGFRSRQAPTPDVVSSHRSSGTSYGDYDEYGDEEDEEEDDWAPLRASANAIPAGLTHEDERSEDGGSPTSSSDHAPDYEDEEEDDDDDEDDGIEYENRSDRMSPSQARKHSIIRQGSNRPSTAPSSVGRKISPVLPVSSNNHRLYKPSSMTGLHSSSRRLSAFLEEEEEEEENDGETEGESQETDGQRTPVSAT